MASHLKNALFLVKVVRAKDWVIPMVGIVGFALVDFNKSFSLFGLICSLLFNAIYFSAGFIQNNYFDTEEDEASKNHLINLSSQQKFKEMLVLSFTATALVTSLFFSLTLPLISVFLINFLYSCPPFRLKRFLLPSLVSNCIFYGFAYYSTAHIISPNPKFESMILLPYVLAFFVSLQYLHFLEHMQVNQLLSLPWKAGALFSFLPLFTVWSYEQVLSTAPLLGIITLYSIAVSITLMNIKNFSQIRKLSKYFATLAGVALVILRIYA